MFISMHVTVDDGDFCYSLELVYVKYKSCASTARKLPDNSWVLTVNAWRLIACNTAFYAIINITCHNYS